MSGSTTSSICKGKTMWWSRIQNRSKFYLAIYGLMLPTFVGMAIFNYYPKWEAIKYSLFRWDGSGIEEFRGFANFVEIFTADPQFWATFKLVGILLFANLLKMWPCIFAAIVLHRLRSERWQYIYRVLFVIPMVVPALVGLLIWKSFYDPATGILNSILNGTGMMELLKWLDVTMPALAEFLTPLRTGIINPVFGSVWGLGLLGAMLLSIIGGAANVRKGWFWWLTLTIAGIGLMGAMHFVIWFAVVLVLGTTLSKSYNGQDILKWLGGSAIAIASLIVLLGMIWVEPTKAFVNNTPAWLGNSKLVIPAIIFWGFPWIGTIGVLIYLAGLQNISADVYEAAALDGVGPLGKLFKIELPLIMTQVRINLIFMTIGTLNTYAFFLVLLGPNGGPGCKGLVPGLYMYRVAFIENRLGYACALGMVMFAVILGITIFYQKYVKVEK